MRRDRKRLTARAWIAIVAGFVVIGVVAADLGKRKSPGELTTVHGVDADLNGRWDCSSCHGGFRSTMTDACLQCHEPIAAQIEAHTGLHGIVASTSGAAPRTAGVVNFRQCAACHSEHHGAGFKMVNARSFTAAGVADVALFDHKTIGFAMDGRHLEIECVKCHKSIDVVTPKKDEHRYGGLTQDCVSCHKDFHEGKIAIRCGDCHDQTDWKRIAYPDHAKLFALVGPHADRNCRECHAKDAKRSLEQAGRAATPATRECRECHESPHAEKFVAASAFFATTTPGASCALCHKSDHMKFRVPELTLTAEEHARSGFPIEAPHDKVKCDDCHAPKLETFKARYPGRREDDCESCHKDPHGGQFKTAEFLRGPFGADGCLACHERIRFKPHAFTLAKHALSSLPLTGRHAEADCNSCHKVPAEKVPVDKVAAKGIAAGKTTTVATAPVGSAVTPPRTFRGIPDACDRCHSDAHAGSFDAIAAKQKRVDHGACARCHDTKSFSNLPANGFDHLTWTHFPLLQAHEAAACESCHPRATKPDRIHRSFGRIVDRYGKLAGCVTCHRDPHGGEFDRKEVPAEVEGRRDCERCHDESSFRSIRGTFDHGAWTGYPLADGHATIGCAQCHAPRAAPDELARTTERARGPLCADCHEDVHAGQFVHVEKNACERCHKSAAKFSVLVFKHNLHSRFPLDETHSAVACADCHRTEVVNGASVVRYRPLGRNCADCHTAPSDPLRRRKGKQG